MVRGGGENFQRPSPCRGWVTRTRRTDRKAPVAEWRCGWSGGPETGHWQACDMRKRSPRFPKVCLSPAGTKEQVCPVGHKEVKHEFCAAFSLGIFV